MFSIFNADCCANIVYWGRNTSLVVWVWETSRRLCNLGANCNLLVSPTGAAYWHLVKQMSFWARPSLWRTCCLGTCFLISPLLISLSVSLAQFFHRLSSDAIEGNVARFAWMERCDVVSSVYMTGAVPELILWRIGCLHQVVKRVPHPQQWASSFVDEQLLNCEEPSPHLLTL